MSATAFDPFDLMNTPPLVFQIKRCKSGRHQYIGQKRCLACKREYDKRYSQWRRDNAKRVKVMFQFNGRYVPAKVVSANLKIGAVI